MRQRVVEMADLQTAEGLLEAMQQLRGEVLADADELFDAWRPVITRAGFEESARNLACYLALRRHELPALQLSLMRWGLSSLGRSESRVQATLDAVIATLGAICRRDAASLPPYPHADVVFDGTRVLDRETAALFGNARSPRQARILVTLPSEAAEDLAWMQGLVQSGIDGVRINCAHDSEEVWAGMLRNLRIAERELGSRSPIFVLMDLGGPKLRTLRPKNQRKDLYHVGDKLLLTAPADMERLSTHQHGKHKNALPVVGCTFPEALEHLSAGDSVCIDDGRIAAHVLERAADGVVIKIMHAPSKGHKIRPRQSTELSGHGVRSGVAHRKGPQRPALRRAAR